MCGLWVLVYLCVEAREPSGTRSLLPPCWGTASCFCWAASCRLASLWVSGRFSSLPPLSHSQCWGDRCIGPHPASYMCSRLTQLLLSPAATSLPPTFFSYVLQITQGLTNRISIKVNCSGLTYTPLSNSRYSGAISVLFISPSPASQWCQHSQTSTKAGSWVTNS